MLVKSLKQDSKTLSSISLQSFIVDATSQDQNYNYYELLNHPNINTVKPQFQQLLKLFSHGTYRSYENNKTNYPKLSEKQLQILRRLTLLSSFQGINAILLSKLQDILHINREEIISLLLELNISGIINIKIDQQNEKVMIFGSDIRGRSSEESDRILRAKIAKIVLKNKQVRKAIHEIQKHIS